MPTAIPDDEIIRSLDEEVWKYKAEIERLKEKIAEYEADGEQYKTPPPKHIATYTVKKCESS